MCECRVQLLYSIHICHEEQFPSKGISAFPMANGPKIVDISSVLGTPIYSPSQIGRLTKCSHVIHVWPSSSLWRYTEYHLSGSIVLRDFSGNTYEEPQNCYLISFEGTLSSHLWADAYEWRAKNKKKEFWAGLCGEDEQRREEPRNISWKEGWIT